MSVFLAHPTTQAILRGTYFRRPMCQGMPKLSSGLYFGA